MTCIVGFTDPKNKVTYIGGDSRGNNGLTFTSVIAPKVFKNETMKNVIMGSTSTFRHIDVLQYADDLFPEIDALKKTEIDRKYMITKFIPRLRETFAYEIPSKDSRGGEGANFLLGVNGKLFEIQTDYSVIESACGFNAVGCGEDIAIGSLYATTMNCKKYTPIDHIKCALEAAAFRSCGVAGPFTIINTANNEIITFYQTK